MKIKCKKVKRQKKAKQGKKGKKRENKEEKREEEKFSPWQLILPSYQVNWTRDRVHQPRQRAFIARNSRHISDQALFKIVKFARIERFERNQNRI